MVKITYSPVQELVVHDIIEVTKEDLLRERVTPQGTMPLYWCNGLIFSFASLPMTDEVTSDYIKGRIHWLEIHFARMDKFVSVLALNEEEYKTAMNVRVIDTSISDLHREFTSWLKSNVKTKK